MLQTGSWGKLGGKWGRERIRGKRENRGGGGRGVGLGGQEESRSGGKQRYSLCRFTVASCVARNLPHHRITSIATITFVPACLPAIHADIHLQSVDMCSQVSLVIVRIPPQGC